MKRISLLLICAAIFQTAPCAASDSPELTSGQVGIACQISGGNEDAEQLRLHVCLIPIKFFVDGYRRGAENALQKTFTKQAENRTSTREIEKFRPRTAALKPFAHCLPANVTTEQIADVFLKFSANHPDSRNKSFAPVLADAIEAKYCPN